MASNWLKAELLRTSARPAPPPITRREVAALCRLPARACDDNVIATAQRAHAA
jgi:hypothetical protein